LDDVATIFLLYSSPDYERVHEYYLALLSEGFDPWLDKEKLVAGQSWDFEIKRALARAAIIVVFLSDNSVVRRSYVQREIRIALDQAQNRLQGDIYLVPVMLDDVAIPEQLEGIHVVRAEAGDPYKQLSQAIGKQLEYLGLQTAKLQGDPKLRWQMTRHTDRWEGLPGYDTSFQLPRFSSENDPQVSEITDVIRGWLAAEAMKQREVKFSQSTEFCSFGQEAFFRTDSWDASCNAPIVRGRIVSVSYVVWTMSAGAAHPNMHFKTFSFLIGPVCQIISLQSIFSDADGALAAIQDAVRYQLLRLKTVGDPSDGCILRLDAEWVENGTAEWGHFADFVFGPDGIDILFSPYSVGPYAAGPQSATVSYEAVAKFMLRHFAYALDVEHLQRERKGMLAVPALDSVQEGQTGTASPDGKPNA